MHFNFIINEKEYYNYYTGNCSFIILPDAKSSTMQINVGDTAVLHCQYQTGELNKGRHIAPIYRTIIYIGKGNVNDVGFKYTILSIR